MIPTVHKKMIEIVKSRHIKLREYCIEDMDAYLDWQCSEKVGFYLNWLPRTKQEAKQSLIEAVKEQKNLNRQLFYMAIVRNDDDEIVGGTGIKKISSSEGNIGWFLRPGFEGNGYAVEGARLMVNICFRTLGLSLLRASCYQKNTKSERIMKKLGFKIEHTTEDRLLYILKSEN